jgi:hypothetical protein
MVGSSMVVGDLNVFGARGRPAEADAKLIIHTDAVLRGSIAL